MSDFGCKCWVGKFSGEPITLEEAMRMDAIVDRRECLYPAANAAREAAEKKLAELQVRYDELSDEEMGARSLADGLRQDRDALAVSRDAQASTISDLRAKLSEVTKERDAAKIQVVSKTATAEMTHQLLELAKLELNAANEAKRELVEALSEARDAISESIRKRISMNNMKYDQVARKIVDLIARHGGQNATT